MVALESHHQQLQASATVHWGATCSVLQHALQTVPSYLHSNLSEGIEGIFKRGNKVGRYKLCNVAVHFNALPAHLRQQEV